MAVVAGAQRTDMTGRVRVDVPADEVVLGDMVRDQGMLRRIARVEPSVVELSLVWVFDPVEGLSGQLRVPSLMSVSVWRVSGAR